MSHFGEIRIPRTLLRLFRLSLLTSLKLKSLVPRLVSLLHRALRMNAIPRIGIFATDGAKVFSDFRNEWYWLEDAHVAPKLFRWGVYGSTSHTLPTQYQTRTWSGWTTKKPTWWNTPEAFHHVGLLVNGSPAVAANPLSSLPLTCSDYRYLKIALRF